MPQFSGALENHMTYAHIFRLPHNRGWQLLITVSPSLSDVGGVLESREFGLKHDAKRFAAQYGATAWNY